MSSWRLGSATKVINASTASFPPIVPRSSAPKRRSDHSSANNGLGSYRHSHLDRSGASGLSVIAELARIV